MSIANVLRRASWAIPLVSLGLVAAASARGVNAAARLAALPEASELTAPPLAQTPATAAPAHGTDASPVLERNPFDSAQGRLERPGAALPEPEAASMAPEDIPACTDVTLLVAVAAEEPERSLASFQHGQTTLLRRPGDMLADSRVEAIAWDRALLARPSGPCVARLFGPAPAPVSANVTVTAVPGEAAPDELTRGIRQISATEFEIDRSVRDRVMESPTGLLASVRVAKPKPGDPPGLQLRGIKAGSLLGNLGVKDGDRLQSLNGFDVTNPEKALEAYARLRGAERLSMKIERGGTPLELEYQVK